MMIKQFEKTLVASGEVKFNIQKEFTELYVYSTDAFETSVYGYDGNERELQFTIPSDAHDDMRIRFQRYPDGTVLLHFINSGDTDHEDVPVYVELAQKRYTKFSVISNAVTTVQVWE